MTRPQVLFTPPYWRNPYLELLAAAVREAGADVVVGGLEQPSLPDVLHLHWERAWIVSPRLLAALRGTAKLIWTLTAARRAGVPVVWTLHNLKDHDRNHPRFERGCQLLIGRLVDAVVVHHPAAVEIARRWLRLPASKLVVVTPKGGFPAGVYAGTREQARDELDLRREEFVLVALGAVRPYKRLDVVVEAVRRSSRSDLRLVVAGWPGSDADRMSLEVAAGDDPRIRIDARYLDDEEFERYLVASDGMVLAVDQHFSSGSAVQAVSAGRAVLSGPSAHVDFVCGPGGHVEVDCSSAATLAADFDRLEIERLRAAERANAAVAAELNWAPAGRILADLYTSLLRSRR